MEENFVKAIKKLITLVCIFSVFAGIAASRGANRNSGEMDIKYSPEQYDSMFSNWYENNIASSYDNFFDDFIDIDLESVVDTENIPDSVYEARLRMISSVIQLPYNDIVRKYIILYTKGKSVRMENILGLAQCYFPYIEEELDRQGLPLELKILPIIESALSPKAVSRAGATGLWQFMLPTGRFVGLEINSFVDERMDPMASTRGACKYLQYLYDIYGDWTLAIAAYNCGPGNVNKALKRVANGKTYWDIYPYLPRETRGYVPAFIAATYAYTFHKAHKIEPCSPPYPISTDTVMVNRMMHLEQISSTLDIPINVLRDLNPQYKRDIIPRAERSYSIVLPQYAVTSYIEKETEIYSKDSLYLKDYLNPANFKIASQASMGTTYKVKNGDVLGAIARRHGVTVNAIVRANNLKNANSLRLGQVLVIP